MNIAKALATTVMFGFSIQALAGAGEIKIVCQSDAQSHLDTRLGFVLPFPDGFDPRGNPAYEIHSIRSAEARTEQRFTDVSVSISARKRRRPDELSRWDVVEIDHPNAAGIEIRHDFIGKKNGDKWFRYVMINEDYALFLRSIAELDLNSVLDCFV